MCGIAGIVGKGARGKGPIVKAMTDAIAHRGPDGEGSYAYDNCVLGHRRLAIVDLSPGGKQPKLSPDGSVAVTFNGEVYGYKEVKSQLTDYKFQTQSDTEVILALYQKYGQDFIKHLPGQFALALWDDKSQTLLAARDRFGEKPFYYALADSGEFVFASEIKALLATGLIKPEVNPDALAHYLHKLYVHPAQTIYKNIFTLAPAHQLVYKNGAVGVSKYWDIPTINENISLEEALPEFKRLLDEAVRKQLVADVPVGAFLSGGLDSTTIVALASKYAPKIKTFAFGFDSSKNELHFAKMAADKYGTEHYELNDTDYDIASLLQTMAGVYDEPFADSSNIPTYLISQQTRARVTVALSGDGADELLSGYGGYKEYLPKGWLGSIFDSAPKRHNVYFTGQELAALGAGHIPAPSPLATPDDAMRSDLADYMPGDILVKTDRASMAHALELRAPFLDWQFAEFAASLPWRLKLSCESDKIILRRAFAELWPEPIRTRTKQGFGAPVKQWLALPKVAALTHEYLEDPGKKIFTQLSFEQSRPYVAANNYKTWILLVLSLWMESNAAL
jgi:asparagine synthase (glutamine-hydrolysing)